MWLFRLTYVHTPFHLVTSLLWFCKNMVRATESELESEMESVGVGVGAGVGKFCRLRLRFGVSDSLIKAAILAERLSIVPKH